MTFPCARGMVRTARLVRHAALGGQSTGSHRPRPRYLPLSHEHATGAGGGDAPREPQPPRAPPVRLTKEYIRAASRLLEETGDAEVRGRFFKRYMVEDVRWEITGSGHELAGTRNSLADHSAVSFSRLAKRLTKPIKFVVRSIILEPDTRCACIEMKGFATRTNGQPYNNDYIWLTEWNDEGKIFSVRSYHDTNLAEKVLHEE